MKPENKFRKWFEDKARGYLSQKYPGLKVRFQKHADAVTAGIADMDISIGGITIWIEFKLLTSCKKERKLDVTALQHEFLQSVAQAGVPSGLCVGLTLGPRQGYDVAFYHAAIPTQAVRNDFRPWTIVVGQLLALAQLYAAQSHDVLSQVDLHHHVLLARPALSAHRTVAGLDDVLEDGG